MLTALTASSLLAHARCVATAVPGSERALPPTDLASRWQAVTGATAQPVADPEAALEHALDLARGDGGVLVIAGSLYLVGYLRARLVPDTISDDDA